MKARVAGLVAAFEAIERTRMVGVPILNRALRVEAVGFAPLDADDALGVLITPWFMNLVRLPLRQNDATDGIGRTRTLDLHDRRIAFIGAHEQGIGAFAACSLFSPVHEFRTQADAVATAEAVLRELRQEAPPARRSFLFGRGEAVAR